MCNEKIVFTGERAATNGLSKIALACTQLAKGLSCSSRSRQFQKYNNRDNLLRHEECNNPDCIGSIGIPNIASFREYCKH